MNFTFNKDYFNMNELINKAYETVRHQAALKDVKIIKEYLVDIDDEKSRYYGLQTNYEMRKDFFT